MRNIGSKLFLALAFLCCSLVAVQAQTNWTQWALNPQHSLDDTAVTGQVPNRILANIVYDPNVPTEQADNSGELLVHYQVPLVEGSDVYMEFKGGKYTTQSYATQTWGENKFTWVNGQLQQIWSFQSDWKAPGNQNDFWEPVFHASSANGFIYMPGASGSIIKVSKSTGAMVSRIAPFGTTNSNIFTVSPLTVDSSGNLFYNVLQLQPSSDFYAADAVDSWIVKVSPTDSFQTASYSNLVPGAPARTDQCLAAFREGTDPLPWPPSPTAVPISVTCGLQRVALNIAPAIAPDGTIYSVTRAHFISRHGFLVAINPNLTSKWAASLRNRFADGCGVSVANGGILPPNGQPGGCRVGANLGVDPATNTLGGGRVLDDSSSTPTVAPDGSVLYGAYARYDYAQGYLMHFDANGNFLNWFIFGWDSTPAIYNHGNTYSIVIKNNHYGGVGSYCNTAQFCPTDRTATNPASPEQYFVTQLNTNLNIEWSWQNTNTNSCTRNADGSITCTSDHPNGFEFCVNAPVVDANGRVYVNSEDGNLYVINQGGTVFAQIFQQLALGAAYTPASLGSDGKIYSQNDGRLFVVGQ
jgi:hypothetical protein